jgi:hypothetical protein
LCISFALLLRNLTGSIGNREISVHEVWSSQSVASKDTKLSERLNLQSRTDMFDVLNHPNFGNPVLTATSKSLGLIGSTRFPTGDFGSSRQIQLSLFLQF